MALGVFGAGGGDHDAGVVGEDVEALLVGEEVVDGGFDGREVGEVEFEEGQLAVGGGVGFLDLGNGRVGFGLGAAGEVDGAVAAVEDLAKFFAAAGVASGDDEDLREELVGLVLLSSARWQMEWRFGIIL